MNKLQDGDKKLWLNYLLNDWPGKIILGVLAVALINADADLAIGLDAVPVDVEHVGVGLGDGLLHQVPVPHVDLLL